VRISRLIFNSSVVALAMLWGCKGFMGEKTDLSFIETPVQGNQESETYLPILPALQGNGMIEPTDICSGYDQLIYVTDPKVGKVFCFDQAGRQLSDFSIPGAKAVIQDLRLNLLVIGTVDTTVGQTTYKLPAIFRLNLDNGGYGLRNARIIKRMIHPFYFKSALSATDANVKLNDIAVFADNSYLVTRSGNINIPTQFGGPDNTVLRFSKDDEWQGIVSVSTNQGTFSNYFQTPYSITTIAQPPIPPSTLVSNSKTFFVSMLEPNTTIKVQAINEIQSESGTEYVLNTSFESGDTSKADGFLYAANRFTQPMGLTYQYASAEYLFIVDAVKDSVYQFTKTGLEGVQPLPGASRKKPIITSFGCRGSGPKQFNRPVGVATVGRTLYICDAGNGRILRYRLTRDME